ncbi:hypothetical protein BH11BAC1_BH11BAC1_28800 [soil metagenome]
MKRKHFYLFLSIVLLNNSIVFAQGNYEDVLYLKNGSVLHGIIIEQVPSVSIKLQTKDKNVFVFTMEEILKITKEETVPVQMKRQRLTKDNIKKRGYQNITEITLGRNLLGNNNESFPDNINEFLPAIGIQTINGYMFNPYLSAGIGIGLHLYFNPAFVPVFADVHLNFSDGLITAFVAVDAGYSFTGTEIYGIASAQKYSGGGYFNPVLGIKTYSSRNTALVFSFGYRQQECRFYETEYGSYPNYYEKSSWKDVTLGYFNTRIGVVF